MESLAAIRQLPYRYALCLDSRDIDTLVTLFVPDVRVGRDDDRPGGAAPLVHRDDAADAHVHPLHRQPHRRLRRRRPRPRDRLLPRRARAAGDRGDWENGTIQYYDTYVRVDGEWCFQRRKFNRWYMVDALTRPAKGAGVGEGKDALATGQLPDIFPTWAALLVAIRRLGPTYVRPDRASSRRSAPIRRTVTALESTVRAGGAL